MQVTSLLEFIIGVYSALHLASSSGFVEMTETIMLHRAKLLREDKDA